MVGGFKGEAVVNDGGEQGCRDEELQRVKCSFFHAVVWVVGWPSRLGWVNGSGYLGGVNPQKRLVAIRDLDTPPSVNVLPPSPWITKHGIG